MIRLVLGGVGSGKTAMIVRELVYNDSHRVTFSNIQTKKIKHNKVITDKMLIKKEITTGQRGKITTTLTFNEEFWKNAILKHKSINVILDEGHTLFNPRRSMSKKAIIMTDFLSLIRRILGQSADGYGELIVITQLERRLDVVLKEMATRVDFCVCHYVKSCKKCHYSWNENNEYARPKWNCPNCNSRNIIKHSHVIEVWSFKNIRNYEAWRDMGMKTYYDRILITDIDNYFGYYDTLQWDNLLSDY